MDEIRKTDGCDVQTALAKDVLQRLPRAAQPLLDLFDECLQAGLILQFETLAYVPHIGRHALVNPRVVKVLS